MCSGQVGKDLADSYAGIWMSTTSTPMKGRGDRKHRHVIETRKLILKPAAELIDL